MKILRKETDLTPEMVAKIKAWLKTLTWEDFAFERVQSIQTITDILEFGEAREMPVIRYGEVFIVASIYSRGDICIAKLTKSKKGHEILHVIGQSSDYNNYCSHAYYAVPFLD